MTSRSAPAVADVAEFRPTFEESAVLCRHRAPIDAGCTVAGDAGEIRKPIMNTGGCGVHRAAGARATLEGLGLIGAYAGLRDRESGVLAVGATFAGSAAVALDDAG